MSSSPTDPTIDCDFPKAALLGYYLVSRRSGFYNCIAWAIGKSNNKWWPLSIKARGWYWPPGIRCDVSMAAFIEMFSAVGGYEIGTNRDIEHDTLDVLESSDSAESIYGRRAKLMRRIRRPAPP
jgi:hypothetical protein